MYESCTIDDKGWSEGGAVIKAIISYKYLYQKIRKCGSMPWHSFLWTTWRQFLRNCISGQSSTSHTWKYKRGRGWQPLFSHAAWNHLKTSKTEHAVEGMYRRFVSQVSYSLLYIAETPSFLLGTNLDSILTEINVLFELWTLQTVIMKYLSGIAYNKCFKFSPVILNWFIISGVLFICIIPVKHW